DYQGYRSDIARTAVLGRPSAKLAAYYQAMLEGEEAMLAAIRPGIPAEDLFRIAVATVQEAGVPHYRRQHVGHAIGLEVYDALSLAPGVQTPLEAGMTLAVETPYYELGWGGVQVEDLVCVTDDGVRLLNRSSRDLIVLPV
ncbi:MAG TPA: M24 family metallopeptidase, partial [Gemmatimonadaceae bacterium]